MKNKKIKICGMNYEIKFVDPYDENLLLKGTYRAGITSRLRETIYIDETINEEMLKRVIIHELTHVFIYASGMGQLEWNEENVADFAEAHLLEIYGIYKKIIDDLLSQKAGG